MVRFLSLSSGSSGNCYFLESEEGALLIDAGIPIRTITKELKKINRPLDSSTIKGILITHEHADHIRSVGGLGGGLHIPIYANSAVHNSIATSRFISEDISSSRRDFILGDSLYLAGFQIRNFRVPHDSIQNYGYYIQRGNFSFMLATDVGHITEEMKAYASIVNYLVIEANYDHQMLLGGAYPSFLKERVSSPFGHLCNSETARFLAEVYTPKLKHVWLCHLSKDNNHPELCWKSIESHLYQLGLRVGRTPENGTPCYEGKDLILDVLPRTKATQIYTFDD